jgi:iron(III) transport system permease protein
MYQIVVNSLKNSDDVYQIITDSRILSLVGKSIVLAVLVSFISTIISLPLAYIFANFQFPGKKLLLVLMLIPFFIPPYNYAISWINMLSESGFLFSFNVNIYGFFGTVGILSCWLFPLSLFMIHSSARINVRLEEAANLVTNKASVLFKITLPLILPGILAGSILTFILAVTNFSVPGALRLNVFPSEIFIQFGAYFNHQEAIFLSFPMLILSFIFILLFTYNYSGRLTIAEQKNDLIKQSRLKQNQALVFYFLCGILLFFILGIPLISLLTGAGSLLIFMATLTQTITVIKDTLIYNLLSSVILTCLGFFLAYYRRKLSSRLVKILMDLIILMLIAIPGTVFAIIIIKLIQFSQISTDLLSNPFSAVLISNIRYLPIAYFIFISGLARVPEKYLEVARITAQSQWKIFSKILIPLNKESILSSLFIVFVFCLGELDSAIMIFPPGFETIPLRIYSLLHYGANEMVYALSLIQVLIIIIMLIIGFKWINKSLGKYA